MTDINKQSVQIKIKGSFEELTSLKELYESGKIGLKLIDNQSLTETERWLKTWLTQLKSADEEQKYQLITELGQEGHFNQEVLEALFNCLLDTSLDLRWLTAEVLGQLGSEKAVDPLISCLTNNKEDDNVRQAAAIALGKIGSKKAVKPLINCLSNNPENWFLSRAGMIALNNIGSDEALQAVNSFRDNIVKEIAVKHQPKVQPLEVNIGQWIEDIKQDIINKQRKISEGLAQILTEPTLTQRDNWQLVTVGASSEMSMDICGARGGKNKSTIDKEIYKEITFNHLLKIAGQNYLLKISPYQNDDDERVIWRFALYNSTPGGFIPSGFKLKLLEEDGEMFEEDMALGAKKELYIDVIVAPGEGIIWETEPYPEGYQRQIYRLL